MGYDMSLEAPDEQQLATKGLSAAEQDSAVRARDEFQASALRNYFPDLDIGDWERRRTAWKEVATNHPDIGAAYEKLQDKVLEVYNLPDPTYFRLNIWGMGRYRRLMDTAGMLSYSEHPDWPDAEAFRIPSKKVVYEGKEYDEHDEESPEYQAYDAAGEAVRAFIPDEPGIAAMKLGSNDGWLVTPDECQSALDIWDALNVDQKLSLRTYADSDEETINTDFTRLNDGPEQVAAIGENGRVVATLIEPYVPDPDKYYWDSWLNFLRAGVQSGGFRVW